ncbi:MAG: hypothetical protein ARM1_0169 [Candidatus Micrarchaeota archaeon]|nr:MAG: hypothetical protein ARM1_0169 [Candidatus Micrarchaeota archaeon]
MKDIIVYRDRRVSYLIPFYRYRFNKELSAITVEEKKSDSIVEILIKAAYALESKIKVEQDKSNKDTVIIILRDKKILKEILDAADNINKFYRKPDAYTAYYLKGLYEAIGSREGSRLIFKGIKADDILILSRVGLKPIERKGYAYINKVNEFFDLVNSYANI